LSDKRKALLIVIEISFLQSSAILSLETHITKSTICLSSLSPFFAISARRVPSALNGKVTTAIINAPAVLAAFAITGVAPVPVPPPRPAARNTMSAPATKVHIFS